MLKFGSVRSNQSQSTTLGLPTNGGLVLKYFLSETIHNGSRGTHFAKFLISNFLNLQFIYQNPHPGHEHNRHFVRFFLHNQDKKDFFLQILSHCNGALLTALQYGGPPSLTSLIQQQVRIQNCKDQILSMFHPKSHMAHGSVFKKRSSKLIRKIDSDHIVHCYCVCCPHLHVKWKKSRFETSLGRKHSDLCF